MCTKDTLLFIWDEAWGWCVILLSGVQVLVGHTKAEVFDMVRDLDLPLEQGNIQLLKKLQALGLHANRYVYTLWLVCIINSDIGPVV